MQTVFLVRHAEPTVVGYAGPHDPDLTARGMAQARALAERMAREHVVAIYASPVRRAIRTAEVVAARLGLPVEVEHDLRHIDFGQWRDLSLREIEEYHPEWYKQWLAHAESVSFPGGEGLADVQVRAVRALRRALTAHPESGILFVCHDYACRSLLAEFLGVGAAHHTRFRVDMASISTVQVLDGVPILVSVNDTCHLRELNG